MEVLVANKMYFHAYFDSFEYLFVSKLGAIVLYFSDAPCIISELGSYIWCLPCYLCEAFLSLFPWRVIHREYHESLYASYVVIVEVCAPPPQHNLIPCIRKMKLKNLLKFSHIFLLHKSKVLFQLILSKYFHFYLKKYKLKNCYNWREHPMETKIGQCGLNLN